MTLRIRLLFIYFLLCLCAAFPVCGGEVISSYTQEKIDEFMTLHMQLTACATNAEALAKIDAFEAETDSMLPSVAVDYEQEKLILESVYLMERYHYKFDPNKNRAELRALFKSQMQKNEELLDSLPKGENANKWLYLFTGDVTSFYMTRSLPATLRYGMHVKKLYQKALELDAGFTFANLNLGNWIFYAPKIVGGGLNKSQVWFQTAFDNARTAGEQYAAALQLSQFWFEKQEPDKCREYLAVAERLIPGSKEVARTRKVNNFGISLFQYNRNQSGIDEKMDKAEMDENDI